MLAATVDERQREAYLAPYVRGETVSAIGISEPGAGSDPAGMIRPRAVRDGDDWILNGRKIWITKAAEADFTIVMAVTDKEKGARGGMTAFLVDRDAPGFNVVRPIPMIGGHVTYEVALDDCRVRGGSCSGREGQGFAPMQLRLGTRRAEMAANAIGMAQRALEMMIDYAPQRTTFGKPLSERQTVQNWIADAATRIHAARLMTYDCAWKIDEGRDVRPEISMIKSYAMEMAWEVVDHAMQCFGAMGDDARDAAAPDGVAAARHADLRRADRGPQLGGRPQPAGDTRMREHITVRHGRSRRHRRRSTGRRTTTSTPR